MTKLYPPIGAIEEDLFSPSDRLIERWIDGGSALSDASRAALEADPAAREKREIFEASNAQPPQVGLPTIAEAGEQAGMPPWLMEMIERRSAAGTRFSGPAEPMAGQLRLVDRAVGPDGGDLGWDMNRPLAVLLWRETEDPGVWAGWMASHEADYAGYWDVLLVEEDDQPCDPLVAMIQLWNPVQVYGKSTGRVLGQLSESRLAALAAAFSDFLSGERPDASHARPGTLIDRLTMTGERLMTGTPVGGREDPRRRYQDLYFAAAGMVKDVARLAVEAAARQADEVEPAGDAWATVTAWLGQLVERLPAFAAGWALPLEPVMPEAAMGEIPDVGLEGYRIPGLLEVQLIPLEAEEGNAVLKLGLRSLAETPLTVQLMQGSRVLQRLTLAPGSREEGIRVSPTRGLRLEMNDGKGGQGTWDLSG